MLHDLISMTSTMDEESIFNRCRCIQYLVFSLNLKFFFNLQLAKEKEIKVALTIVKRCSRLVSRVRRAIYPEGPFAGSVEDCVTLYRLDNMQHHFDDIASILATYDHPHQARPLFLSNAHAYKLEILNGVVYVCFHVHDSLKPSKPLIHHEEILHSNGLLRTESQLHTRESKSNNENLIEQFPFVSLLKGDITDVTLTSCVESFIQKHRRSVKMTEERTAYVLGFITFTLRASIQCSRTTIEYVVNEMMSVYHSLLIVDLIDTLHPSSSFNYSSDIIFYLKELIQVIGNLPKIDDFILRIQSNLRLLWKVWKLKDIRYTTVVSRIETLLPLVDVLKEKSKPSLRDKFQKFSTLGEAVSHHNAECPICLSPVSDAPDVALLSHCTHVACLPCIKKWFRTKRR